MQWSLRISLNLHLAAHSNALNAGNDGDSDTSNKYSDYSYHINGADDCDYSNEHRNDHTHPFSFAKIFAAA